MRAAILPVTPELIAELLKLPSKDEIVHAEFHFDTREIRFYLRGSEKSTLPVVLEGERYPTVNMELQKDEDGTVKFNKYTAPYFTGFR